MSTLSAEPSELARVYLDHALAGRGALAVQTLTDALRSEAIGLVDLFERVIAPAAHRVGDLWQQSRISVADEHFVTQLNQKLIAIAAALRPGPQSNAEHVLACPPDEQHDTGLRMVAELLSAHGYRASMLGAATPIGDLVGYVGESRPIAVGPVDCVPACDRQPCRDDRRIARSRARTTDLGRRLVHRALPPGVCGRRRTELCDDPRHARVPRRATRS